MHLGCVRQEARPRTRLKDNFGWSEKTAQRYMTVANAFKNDTVSDLEISIDAKALYLLSGNGVSDGLQQGRCHSD